MNSRQHKEDVFDRIREAVRSNPSISQSALARDLGVSQATVSRSLYEMLAVRGPGGYYCPAERSKWNELLDALEASGFASDAAQISFAVYPARKEAPCVDPDDDE